jgi:hypothetical protein
MINACLDLEDASARNVRDREWILERYGDDADRLAALAENDAERRAIEAQRAARGYLLP